MLEKYKKLSFLFLKTDNCQLLVKKFNWLNVVILFQVYKNNYGKNLESFEV